MNELLIFGYIDPSVMTYAIQAGAGIVIAIGAFVGLYFKKTKKKVSKKLGIDENRKKEVESDEIEIKNNQEATKTSKAQKDQPKTKKKTTNDKKKSG